MLPPFFSQGLVQPKRNRFRQKTAAGICRESMPAADRL